MKKLSSYKGKAAIKLLADILDPALVLINDKEVVQEFRNNRLKGAQLAIKNHLDDVVKLLAILDGKSVKAFEKECNVFTLPQMFLEVISDKELMSFFGSSVPQEPKSSQESSGQDLEPTQE